MVLRRRREAATTTVPATAGSRLLVLLRDVSPEEGEDSHGERLDRQQEARGEGAHELDVLQ